MSAGGVAVDHALANSPLARASRSLCAGRIGRAFSRRSPGPNGAGSVRTTVWASTFFTAIGCPFTLRLLASGPSPFGS